MDYKKDTNHRGVMSHRSGTSMETFSITLPKKCERLATAIYLVTNFLSDTEPMKTRLRTLSLDFVRDGSVLKNGNFGVEANVLEALRTNILETLSLLELAFIAGLISEMNFTVLKREYVALRDTIEVRKASRESRTDNILGDTFFGTSFHEEEDSASAHPRTEVERAPTQELQKENSFSRTLASRTTMSFRMSDKKNAEPKPDLAGASKGSTPTIQKRATTNVLKESRRARIIKLIKDNREVTIKDIATHFADLSEKTIQRELVALVEGGVLKKFGERRWSKYSLV